MKILKFWLLAGLLTAFALPANAQSATSLLPPPLFTPPPDDPAYDTWQIFTSMRFVLQVTAFEYRSESLLGVLTTGGFYIWRQSTGTVTAYTTSDGKYRIDATSMAVDESRGIIWFGYADGMLSALDLDTQRFRNYNDIRRNDRFLSNRINAMTLANGLLYIAADFGVVLFDTARQVIIDSYTRLGDLPSGVSVRSVFVAEGVIYAGTQFGLSVGDPVADLKLQQSWSVFDARNGFVSDAVTQVYAHQGEIWASAGGVNYRYGSNWTVDARFSGGVLRQVAPIGNGDVLVTTAGAVQRWNPQTGESLVYQTISGNATFTGAVMLNGWLMFGTSQRGVGLATNPGGTATFFVPEGPSLNFFEELVVATSGELIGASSPTPGRFNTGINDTGFYLFADGRWENVNITTNDTLALYNHNSINTAAAQGDQYFFGSWGRGLLRLNRRTGALFRYTPQNSPLVGINIAPSFYVSTGVAADRSNPNYVWAVSWSNDVLPLARFDLRTDAWEVFPQAPEAGTATFYRDIFIDSFGQKWISLLTNTEVGRGLLVLRDPAGGQGEAYRLTSNEDQGNLPSDKVNAIVQDRRGEIWVGTDRGLIRYLFPDRIIGGSSLERRGQPLINEDTTAFDRVLLRDVRVTALVVDANNQKWVGSASDGIYLVEESGRRVIRHFTTDNSPLTSNQITSLALNSVTGEVFIGTANGLALYQALERDGVRDMDALRVYPNPYSYRMHGDTPVVIEALGDNSTVSIMTVDGRLVARFQTRGGRVEWNGRDFQGNQVATGVYFVVATGNTNNQRARGKVVIVR